MTVVHYAKEEEEGRTCPFKRAYKMLVLIKLVVIVMTVIIGVGMMMMMMMLMLTHEFRKAHFQPHNDDLTHNAFASVVTLNKFVY